MKDIGQELRDLVIEVALIETSSLRIDLHRNDRIRKLLTTRIVCWAVEVMRASYSLLRMGARILVGRSWRYEAASYW